MQLRSYQNVGKLKSIYYMLCVISVFFDTVTYSTERTAQDDSEGGQLFLHWDGDHRGLRVAVITVCMKSDSPPDVLGQLRARCRHLCETRADARRIAKIISAASCQR